MDAGDRIRRYILEDLRWGGAAELLTDDYPLIENRVIDSLDIFKMVSFLEQEFGVSIADEDIDPDHFGSIGALAALVRAKAGSV